MNQRDLKFDTVQYIFNSRTDEHLVRTLKQNQLIKPAEKEHIMSKIIAALIAVTLVTAAAAPSYAFGPSDVQSTSTEK